MIEAAAIAVKWWLQIARVKSKGAEDFPFQGIAAQPHRQRDGAEQFTQDD